MFDLLVHIKKKKKLCIGHVQVWEGGHPVNGVMSIDECQEFHQLWSAFQFAICVPVPKNQMSLEWVGKEGGKEGEIEIECLFSY